ncbi:hypothetical protein PENSPDRAFT_656941 [Peniophora sp. CONT]|nr:hypothetical protein PENSPDRAFT_656941 [Peniophora sp. CONT]
MSQGLKSHDLPERPVEFIYMNKGYRPSRLQARAQKPPSSHAIDIGAPGLLPSSRVLEHQASSKPRLSRPSPCLLRRAISARPSATGIDADPSLTTGPYGANIFDPRDWGNSNDEVTNEITLEFTRVVLAIGVFAIGVELPKQYMKHHWQSLAMLLGPIMTWGWFVSAAFIYALIPDLSFLASLTIAACLTPTDPILAAAVIGGRYADKHVPAHLRHLLAAESGCNDGAAFPFLYIALYLLLDTTTGEAIKDWFLILWLYEIVFGVIFGALIGFGFRYLMKFCERKDLIDRQSYVAQYVSLALLTIGVCTMVGTDDLLAAFACGTAFAWDGFFNKQTEAAVFSSVIDLLFNIAAFVFVGAWTPFSDFNAPEFSISVWRLIVIAILVLIFRRLPVILLLYKWIPDIKNWREAVFSGHFGPMGVGAIFISTLAAQQLPEPKSPPEGSAEIVAATIQPIVSFMVVVSIVIHGLSIPFFSLGRRVHTVTRTWSRQPSLPDWAMHTRPITRGEDIVINRDDVDAAERGELGPIENATAAADAEKEKEGSATPTSSRSADDEKKDQKEGELDAERDARGETVGAGNMPDGEEGDGDVVEWKEGPHKVIERRHGPGEEVEVEIQRNFFGPGHTESISKRFDPSHVNIRAAVRGLLGAAGEAAEHIFADMEHAAEGAEHAAEGAGHAAAEKGARAVHYAEDMISPVSSRASGGSRSSPNNADGEEAEWASDSSDGRGRKKKKTRAVPVGSRHKATRKHKTPLKSSRPAPPPPVRIQESSSSSSIPQDTGSRRGSLHEAASATSLRRAGEGEGDEERGRANIAHSRPVRHLRIDSLRAASPANERRTSSPARSVRWADDPNGLRSPLSPGSSRAASPIRAVSPPRSRATSPSRGEEPDDSPVRRR